MSKKRKYGFQWKNKKLIIGVVAAMVGVLMLMTMLYNRNMATYDGLGEQKTYPETDIAMDGFYQDENNFRVYKNGFVRGIPGVDVSEHQGSIDWQRAGNAGVKFAMVRLGYRTSEGGQIYMDKQYEVNMDGLKKANIPRGVYFFSQATTTAEAIEEASFVVDNIRNKGVNMPVAYDMEPVNEETDRISNLTVQQKTEVADAFCSYIKKAGYEPVIYGNPTWIYNHLDLNFLSDYNLWLAHYAATTDFPYRYKMWQYSEQGRVDGVPGNVDLDIYFK